ncbi:predicted protein [Scheffersomyces stipitis CBS 6054]|uniref:Palmitoyl-protein thioesterase 1 n=1 Tax=Scheffersomyces stipitis (strain ATCC 58785 / CBS 6054 / NBRC 10063 / NRRL Y-11545) TaxID=322104 RepID=A3LW35_PICST|nr:predicted protein [Scheffersomyces stipitis CBS 6054]ABN66895.2 predicted protein [Scheffersomyces stipitis CBS 6054]
MQLSTLLNVQYILGWFADQAERPAEGLRRLGQELELFPEVEDYSQWPPSTPIPKPVVLWHGLGDNFNSSGMHKVATIFESLHPDIYVHSVQLAEDPASDEQKSFVGDANEQLDIVCKQLSKVPQLRQGFDIVGFSQGGVFARALVERCSSISVSNLITFGAPHNGVSELPMCKDANDWLCKNRNEVLKKSVWFDNVQKYIIPAQYFRTPKDYSSYLKYSNFLADINNERTEVNITYKRNLSKLSKFVMVTFDDDTTLIPKDSAGFQDIDAETDAIIPFEQTIIYTRDLLGLQSLHSLGKIDFYSIEGDHMQIPESFLVMIGVKYIGSYW